MKSTTERRRKSSTSTSNASEVQSSKPKSKLSADSIITITSFSEGQYSGSQYSGSQYSGSHYSGSQRSEVQKSTKSKVSRRKGQNRKKEKNTKQDCSDNEDKPDNNDEKLNKTCLVSPEGNEDEDIEKLCNPDSSETEKKPPNPDGRKESYSQNRLSIRTTSSKEKPPRQNCCDTLSEIDLSWLDNVTCALLAILLVGVVITTISFAVRYRNIHIRLDEQARINEQQTADLNSIEEMRHNVSHLLESMGKQVTFSVGLNGTDNVEVAKGDYVKYNHVIANINDAYETSTGVFTCTTPGVYLFTAHAVSANCRLDLTVWSQVINSGVSVEVLVTNGNETETFGSNTMIVWLMKNDKVGVNSTGQISFLANSTENLLNTFTGVLLRRGDNV